MTDSLTPFLSGSRIILEADLKPVIGTRIQPTGFPNLGAAEYELPGKSNAPATMLLVESPQSMANRLESVMWDPATGDLVKELTGLPYVRAKVDGEFTDSLREAHRLNSPFLKGIWEPIRERAEIRAKGKLKSKSDGADDKDSEKSDSSGVDIRKLAKAVFFYDPNSIVHGVFMTNIVGLARLTRLLSSFVEARNVNVVASGGVKNDRVDPSGKRFKGAAEGFGNVPYARTEYSAETIRASFSFDLTLLRSYGLGADAERLVTSLALWKIQRLLVDGMRFRTACDLELIDEPIIKRPDAAKFPSISQLEASITASIAACSKAGLFANPAITEVTFE